MPLLLKLNDIENSVIAVWKNTEGNEYFKNKILISNSDLEEIAHMSDKKIGEWLSSRYLISLLIEDKRPVLKKTNEGKPYLQGLPYEISMSHSGHFTAVILSKSKKRVGIDIQILVEKINRIEHKFVGEEESKWINNQSKLENLHYIWGAKESIYKLYGQKEVDFRKNLFIDNFEKCLESDLTFSGSMKKDKLEINVKLKAKKIENAILVYGIEI